MMMPASAPSTPACHEPSRLSTLPSSSYVAVSSPRYQTLPSLSAAYQSSVASATEPSGRRTTSRKTVVSTPMIVLVRVVTLTVSRNFSAPSVPRSLVTRPGVSGKNGLLWGCLNWLGSGLPAETEAWGAAALVVRRRATADPATARTAAVRVMVMPITMPTAR